LHIAFKEAGDDYIETCVRIGREPQKPASGKLMLPRVQPEVHAAALRAAALAGKSLNQRAAKVIKEAVQA
jgi:predicted HicB family RNase H-like nuclease